MLLMKLNYLMMLQRQQQNSFKAWITLESLYEFILGTGLFIKTNLIRVVKFQNLRIAVCLLR